MLAYRLLHMPAEAFRLGGQIVGGQLIAPWVHRRYATPAGARSTALQTQGGGDSSDRGGLNSSATAPPALLRPGHAEPGHCGPAAGIQPAPFQKAPRGKWPSFAPTKIQTTGRCSWTNFISVINVKGHRSNHECQPYCTDPKN